MTPPPTLRDILSGPSTAARSVQRMAATIALRGGSVRGGVVEAHQKPYCDDPVRIGRRSDPRDTYGHAGLRTVEVSFWGPCRKCEKCLTFRRMRFRQRMINEIVTADNQGRRTWFITLTFSAMHLAGIIAEKVKAGRGTVESTAYAHVQAYFKRLRKWGDKKGVSFRYAAVAEYGEQKGRLHYHLLLSETGKFPLPKRVIETRWRSHVNARLVDCSGDRGIAGAASYVAKYATKAAGTRLRTSQHYGRVVPANDNPAKSAQLSRRVTPRERNKVSATVEKIPASIFPEVLVAAPHELVNTTRTPEKLNTPSKHHPAPLPVIILQCGLPF